MSRGGYRPGAGKKKGYKASHTLQAEQVRKFLIKKVLKEKEPIIDVLIELAKKGNIQAIKEILERVLGKVKEQLELGGGETPIEIVIKKGDPKKD